MYSYKKKERKSKKAVKALLIIMLMALVSVTSILVYSIYINAPIWASEDSAGIAIGTRTGSAERMTFAAEESRSGHVRNCYKRRGRHFANKEHGDINIFERK
ncbi:MAG: hypothetical protein FWC79_01295 [Oscillospiraceae bacterium]|nr:hypothetical protein [Oscillospiraceae bacterium]